MASKAIRGIHVFWWVASFFAVVIALDSLFVVWAVQTFPGEQVKNSYVLGVDFNREVARRKAQEQLGWTAEIGIAAHAAQMLVVRIKAEGGPVTGLHVSASVHVTGQSNAASLQLVEQAPGEYVAPLALASGGRVEIAAAASRAASDAIVFEASKTLELP